MHRWMRRLLLLGLCVALAPACVITSGEEVRGSGDVKSEERPIENVRSVVVTNQGDLFIEIGDDENLVIEAEDNLLEHLEAEQKGSELRLGTRGHVRLRNREPIRYYLRVRSLEGVRTSSSGSIEVPAVEADDFEVHVSSSGSIRIDELVADTLELNISSSGNVTIDTGQVDEQDIRISSSGNYNGRGLKSSRATAQLSSSGSATLQVSDDLNASLSSSGDLRYIGDPEVRKSESSSGRVRRK